MNILFIYRVFPNYGGVEVVTTVLANTFVNDGHHVSIGSFEQPVPELAKQLDDSVDILNMRYPVLSNINKLHNYIIKNKIDIIINQWGLPFKTSMLCKMACRGTNCKFVSVLHGSPYTSKVILKAQDKIFAASNPLSSTFYKILLNLKETVIKWSIRYSVNNSSYYVLLSKSFIQPLIEYSKIENKDKIVAIGNPLTIEVDHNGFDLNTKKKQILYVGRMDFENKRVNRIVDVWEKLSRAYLDWELVLVGDGPHKKELEKTVAERSIINVKFEGFRKEAPIKYYKDARIFMLTSDLEGFGLVVIESMIYGCVPIVYGSYEAIYDIIDNKVNGFITPRPFSIDETIEKMKYLMDNNQNRVSMAEAAMKKAQKFSIDSIKNEWYMLFSKVISD